MHLRMETLKKIQQAVTVYDPLLQERLANQGQISEVKEDPEQNLVSSFKEIRKRLEDFQNEI